LLRAAPAGGRGALGGRKEPGVSVAAGGGRWGGRCRGGAWKCRLYFLSVSVSV